jgi:hypothetical protein
MNGEYVPQVFRGEELDPREETGPPLMRAAEIRDVRTWSDTFLANMAELGLRAAWKEIQRRQEVKLPHQDHENENARNTSDEMPLAAE